MKPSITWTERLRRAPFVRTLLALLFWIGLWWILAIFVDKAVLLPTPAAVARSLFTLLFTGEFWFSVLLSLIRVVFGYLAGCVLGIFLAALCHRFVLADSLLSPMLSIVRAVPVASFIILALVWLGRPLVPVFVSFLMVLPIIAGNVQSGLAHIDPELREVAWLYRLSLPRRLRHLILPAVWPYFRSAAHTSLGLSWKAGVAAEVLCSLSSSIGGKIYETKVYLETDALFAWTITVILISVLIEKSLFRKPKAERRDRHAL